MSSPKTVEVIVEALRTEATTWDTEADAIAGVGTWLGGQTLSGLELGIFNPMGGTYEHARSQIAGWCTQGGTAMHAIAEELRLNANAYESTDVDVAQHVEGAY